MNIEVISSASEETLISFGVFSCAFAFTLWKIYSIQRSKIQFYESQDELGRQSMQNELQIMDNLIAELEREYIEVEKNIEQNLVDLEIQSTTLHPKLKNFQMKQSAGSESTQSLLTQMEAGLHSIQGASPAQDAGVLLQPVQMLRDVIADMNNTVGIVAMSSEQQNQRINQLQTDLTLIKRGHGLE